MPDVLFVWNDELIEYIGQHVFGPTSTGKYLACVFEYTGPDKNEVLPVTAFEVDE